MSDESSTGGPTTGVLLMAHGAPNSVEDIPLFLKNIRGGTESSPEIIELIQDRYRSIGGSSPMLEISGRQAKALENLLNQETKDFKVYLGMRNWSPYIRDAVREMKADGIQRVVALCLAPQYSSWSTELYFKALREALKENDAEPIETLPIMSWTNHPLLIDAFVDRYERAMEKLGEVNGNDIHTVFTVHSIPAESLDYGDPYDEEYDKTLNSIVDRVQPRRWYKAYQSQGMIPVPWLGPRVENVLDRIARLGKKTVLMVPVGFLCDHIEILYDIDIQFMRYATEKKLSLHRTESLNDSPLLTEALAALVWERLL